eukprot:TRINITY_DN568_c0_g2_i3.p1 TRINITY_DN568_c0_g2~~TRINITY_DN568_c0_g2_i3.p1  ORF type:complete len:390 (+),score=87.76 TRINITY_DN568_c0_g2_i3:144-1313(+)
MKFSGKRFSKPPPAPPPDAAPPDVQPATLSERVSCTGCDIFTFRVDERIRLRVGGHLSLRISEKERPYSPIAVRDGEFDVAAKLNIAGAVSPLLFSLQPGDKVQWRGPYAGALPDKAGPDYLLLAAGSGVTPFVQILRAARDTGSKVWLVHSVRSEDESVMEDSLDELASPNCRLLRFYTQQAEPVAPRTSSNKHVHRVYGRRLSAADLNRWCPFPVPGLTAAVCGTPEFNSAVAALLREAGHRPVVFGPSEQLRTAPVAAAAGAVDRRGYSAEEIAAHGTPDDLWVLINGDVYDLSAGRFHHPGGVNVLLRSVGKDATRAFYAAHPWIDLKAVSQHRIGWLARSLSKKPSKRRGSQPVDAATKNGGGYRIPSRGAWLRRCTWTLQRSS